MSIVTPSSQRLSRTAAPFAFLPTPLSSELPVREADSIIDIDAARQKLCEAQRLIQEQEARIRQLETLAMTDELTGLLNRRAMMMTLRRELAATRRNKKNTGLLILIDLDGFKQVNDLHGHAIGDNYLQTVASVLMNEVRNTDYVARLGGDEFAVLLTQITPRDAAARMDRLESVFNKRVMHHREHAIPLCGSFGFALLSETETAESLMIAADMKLYSSKARRKMGMI